LILGFLANARKWAPPLAPRRADGHFSDSERLNLVVTGLSRKIKLQGAKGVGRTDFAGAPYVVLPVSQLAPARS
jgi:hypothetical protein